MNVLARERARFDDARLRWVRDQWRLSPRRITLIYLAFGLLALYGSDVLLARSFRDPLLGQLQVLKGAVEVLLTAGLIFLLTTAKQAQVDRSEAELTRQHEELLVLHRVLRHNLRNDLNVVAARGRQLQEGAGSERDRDLGRVIHRTGRKMLRYTEQAERIRKVTEKNGRLHQIDLAERLPRLVDEHPAITDPVEVRLDVPDGATVHANHMFSEAVGELLENAVSHGERADPTVEITVDPAGGPPGLTEIRVDDDGPGIPDRVVRVLRETEYDQLTHLTGLGLWFVYWVAAESDGDLVIAERGGGGASVRLQLPTVRPAPTDPLDALVG